MVIFLLFSLQIDHIISETGTNIYGAYEHNIPYIVITLVDTNVDVLYKNFATSPDIFLVDTSQSRLRFLIGSERKSMLDTMFAIMDSVKHYPAFVTIVGDIDENYLTSQIFFPKHQEDSSKNYIKKMEKMPVSVEYADVESSFTEITIDAPLPYLNSEDYLPLILGLEWLNYKGYDIGGWRGIIKVKILPTYGKVKLRILCRTGSERKVWKRMLNFISDTTSFTDIHRIKNLVYGGFKTIFTSLYEISDIIILSDAQCADPELFYENIKMYLDAITPEDVKNCMSKFMRSKENWKIKIKGELDRINEQFFLGDK